MRLELVLSQLVLLVGVAMGTEEMKPMKAMCDVKSLTGATMLINGTITMTQEAKDKNLVIKAMIKGPKDAEKHGIHVYDATTCDKASLTTHFGAGTKKHGSVLVETKDYHLGDLGNVVIQAAGTTITVKGSILGIFKDSTNKIMGKAIGITEKLDDLGQSGSQSEKDGNAGEVVACCIITESGAQGFQITLLSLLLPLLITKFSF